MIAVFVFTGLLVPAVTGDYSITETITEVIIVIMETSLVVLFYGLVIASIALPIAVVVRFIIIGE